MYRMAKQLNFVPTNNSDLKVAIQGFYSAKYSCLNISATCAKRKYFNNEKTVNYGTSVNIHILLVSGTVPVFAQDKI